MKKIINTGLKIVGILCVIFTCVVFMQSHIFKMYTIMSTGNEPAIMRKTTIFVSSLVGFENGDFVCFKYSNETQGDQVSVYRLLGMSGDIVELKNGVLYLNGDNFDKQLNLKHLYILSVSEYQCLLDSGFVEEEGSTFKIQSQFYVYLIDKIAKNNGLFSRIKLEPKNFLNLQISKVYHENWNLDNFGPLKIPSGKCFLIGDNRHNSEDSRFIGLINESDIIGTVVKK